MEDIKNDIYSEGTYFKDPNRHIEDTELKVIALKKIIFPFLLENNVKITTYADIGCGSGEIVKLLGKEMKKKFSSLESVRGYDISPHVSKLKSNDVTFCFQDFTKSDDYFDIVTLNDVFEHVVNPARFLKEVGKRAKYVAMHIPLEDCFSVNYRNFQRKKIKNPGHLIFLNINSAINLITFSGLKIVDYGYSFESINSPYNRKSFLQKIVYPFKFVLLKFNPYLYSKIFGNSLIVLAKGIN